jgi:hypothetical protein
VDAGTRLPQDVVTPKAEGLRAQSQGADLQLREYELRASMQAQAAISARALCCWREARKLQGVVLPPRIVHFVYHPLLRRRLGPAPPLCIDNRLSSAASGAVPPLIIDIISAWPPA